ncbi:cell cycle checkpoint control protein RAD9A [Schistocerca gregaria]|uniref:cell cycle checkpoint control protein RAD9A n=1 Tax=Schistocerca gregaria TaxID=7010 RepID=UPI00211E45D2|nr:cell cycle checkpoint control protein RAD9A [Schistocerca gregaria]
MKCIIPGLNVKVLARAIQSLAKIGDELYVEPQKDGIAFRSVNSARSAYATFTFSKAFCSYYKRETSTDNEEIVKCKISMKSCAPIIRSPANLDKQVETCLIHLERDGTKLIFELRCRHNVVKTHYMPILECETLQAVYPVDDVPNKLLLEAKILADAVHNFQLTQEEISLSVTSGKALLKSYNDEVIDRSKVINTELCLEPRDFEYFKVGTETTITFCLKEFKSLVVFAESVSVPVAINFKESGQPVVFMISNKPTFEAHFVLATLSTDSDSQSQTSQKSKSSVKEDKKQDNAAPKAKTTQPSSNQNSTQEALLKQSAVVDPVVAPIENGRPARDEALGAEEIFEMFCDDTEPAEGCSQVYTANNQRSKDVPSSSKTAMKRDIANRDCEMDVDVNMDVLDNRESCDTFYSRNSCTYQTSRLPTRLSDCEDDMVPSSPPSKKARYVFKKCFEATFNPQNIPGHDIVLADDSAGESD